MSGLQSIVCLRARKRYSMEELATKIIVGYLNKRGYNVQDSLAIDRKSRCSTASTASSVSSVIATLREPRHGQSALHIAVRKRDLPVLHALLRTEDVEEFINVPDRNGNTALHFAAAACNDLEGREMVLHLLAAGAAVNAGNNRSLVPAAVLMMKLKKDDPTVLVDLLRHSADPNARVEGDTLLHIACRHNLPKTAYHLVQSGACISTRNQHGLTSFEIASRSVRHAMLLGIQKVQPLASLSDRPQCTACRCSVFNQNNRICRYVSRIAGWICKKKAGHCYRCGQIYCKKCLLKRNVTSSIPSQLYREKADNLSEQNICLYCDRIHPS